MTGLRGEEWERVWARFSLTLVLLGAFPIFTNAADIAGSKDPPEMRRYMGSELIGYREPKFDEFLLPLGPPTSVAPSVYEKSFKIEGLVSRYTYVAPDGRTAAELLRNYKLEFQRLGLTTLYEKAAGEKGWFGPTLDQIAEEDKLGQILAYNENQERVLVGKSKAVKPTYYYLFVTAYADGIVPERLQNVVTKNRALAELVVIAPQEMQENRRSSLLKTCQSLYHPPAKSPYTGSISTQMRISSGRIPNLCLSKSPSFCPATLS